MSALNRALATLFGRGIRKDDFLLWSVLAAWFFCGATIIMQNDSWWHLRTGMEIWARKAVPATDIFSWVLPPGTPWPNHEWLAQVILYGLYEAGGLALVNFAGAVLVTATGALLAACMTGPLLRRSVLLLMIIPWLYTALTVRPQLFSLFCLALLFFLLKSGRTVWLPLLFLIWAQLHGGVVFGGASMIAATAVAAILDRQAFPRLALLTALCGAVVVINPMGFSIYTFPFESVARVRMLPLSEWQPPGFAGSMDRYFWGSALILAGICVYRCRTERGFYGWAVAGIALALFPLAASHARNVYMWNLPAAVAASYFLGAPRSASAGTQPRRGYLAAAGGIWLVTLGLSTWILFDPMDSLRWYPVKNEGIEKLKNLPDPIFTSYDCGGYLLWFAPEKKDFIDSRQDPFPLPLLQETIAVQASGDYQEFFQRFGFRSAIVERKMPLARELFRAGWKIVYPGPAFLVFEKPIDEARQQTPQG